ncbi:MAG: thioredoxin family protein [Candidatus Gracilibacteria bacterium]|nr:thioredoxin family protein [Candidatus Gracilibacteria bacterium]
MSLRFSLKLPDKWPAPDFELVDTQGNLKKLADFQDKQGLLIVFTCNHCPYAIAAWPLLIELHKEFGDKVNFVAINSNDSVNYPADSFDKMKELALPFPYLYDETQEVARAYQAQCTPDLYLFKDSKLYYHGRINDNWEYPGKVTQEELKQALESLISGNEISANQKPSQGCSIKWK